MSSSLLPGPVLLGILGGLLVRPQESPPTGPYICPPCGAECHFVEKDQPGGCGVCGMGLVPLASVPQVGVLVFPGVELLSSTTILGVFAASNAVRAFTVADAVDPVRASDALEIVPQFAVGEAPRLDVLVVPGGWGAHEDPLLVEWAAKTAREARFVLSVGLGSVVLGRGGLLEGQRVAADPWLVEHGKELAPGLVLDAKERWIRNGTLFSARDGLAALDAVLEIVAELAGEERARRTAEQLGHPWARGNAPPGR